MRITGNAGKSALAGRRAGETVCPKCGQIFTCGVAAGTEECWCALLPPARLLPRDGGGCYCPRCLRDLIGEPPA